MTDYKINDTIWFIPNGYFIVIKCTIIEVDDYFRKQESQAYLFYHLDEPVGHDVSTPELFKTSKDALRELKQRYKELLEECVEGLIEEGSSIERANELSKQIFPSKAIITLEEYRRRRINFIVSTWESQTKLDEIKKQWYNELPSKEYGKEWFNIRNI